MAFSALSDTELILIVIAVIYLWECLVWLPAEAVAFTTAFGSLKLASHPTFLQRIDSHAAVLSIFPWSRSIVASEWPVPVSRDGLCILTGAKAGTFIPFGDLKTVEADQRYLRINRTRTKCASLEAARRFANLLTTLRELHIDKRDAVLDEAMQSSFSSEGVVSRIEQVDRSVSALRLASLLLFIWVFIQGPILYYTTESQTGALIRYLAVSGFFWLVGVVLFAIAQRRLLNSPATEQFSRVATLCVSPAGVMRAANIITSDAFSEFTPAAVAAAVMPATDFRSYIGQRLRQLTHPSASDFPDTSPEFRSTRTSFDARQLKTLSVILKEQGIEIDELLRAPVPDFDARTWCPRCLTQYTLESGDCPECLDVPLQKFNDVSIEQTTMPVV
tara:strand:- start:85242 stop:86408 length:1167 start_codon:yes stop_codon:yes gene_type:complete